MALGNLFDKLGDAANKGIDLMGKSNEAVADIQKKMSKHDAGNHSMYEMFSGGWITFALTDNSLVFGKDEYPYSELDREIVVTIPPTKMRVGAAQAVVGGKQLLLQFSLGQAEQFANAVNYANEQIANVKGIVKSYRYRLQSPNGSKLEVYDDYLSLFAVDAGFFGNTMQGGAIGNVFTFAEVSVTVGNDTDGNTALNITQRNTPSAVIYTMPIMQQDVQTAYEIASIIEAAGTTEEASGVVLGEWAPFTGEAKSFAFNGETLDVSQGMDELNTFRKRFFGYAKACSGAGLVEYNRSVRDLVTFLKFFPIIYGTNLDVLVKRAVDILIMQGVYTVTEEAFKERQLSNFHIAPDVLAATAESVELTSQVNVSNMEKVTGLVPNLVGGGFGTKGAIKGIAKAEMFNFVRNTAEGTLLDNASKVNVAQAEEIYGRIETSQLFEAVQNDYWNIYLTLVTYLHESGKDIWEITDGQSQQAEGIFRNLANPNFPKEQLTKTFLEVLKTNPYRDEYQQYMLNTFGSTEETRVIIDYFSAE